MSQHVACSKRPYSKGLGFRAKGSKDPNNGALGRTVLSADLGGRVGWLPKAERVKTLFLSPLQPQNAAAGGGGRGGIPASFPSRSPPPKQPFQPTPTPSPGSYQEVCEKIVI